MHTSLQHLNRCSADEFACLLRPVFDHSAWVAKEIAGLRPFHSRSNLLESLCATVRNLTPEQQLSLIREHHDVAGHGSQTAESSREQAAAGMEDMNEADSETLEEFNQAYKIRFGFPFVICERKNDQQSILNALRERIENSRDVEIGQALKQIYLTASLRLHDLVTD